MLNNKIKTTAQRKHRQAPVDFIKEEALARGACDKIRNAKTAQDLVELLFTPQGLEFASEKGFPTADIIAQCYRRCPSLRQNARLYASYNPTQGDTQVLGDRSIIIAKTEGITFCAKRPEFVHHIILVEGATLRIRLEDYCIAKVTQIGRKGNIINLTPPENAHATLIID